LLSPLAHGVIADAWLWLWLWTCGDGGSG